MESKLYYTTGELGENIHLTALGFKLILMQLFSFEIIESNDKIAKIKVNDIEFEFTIEKQLLLWSDKNKLQEYSEQVLLNMTIKQASVYFHKEVIEFLKGKSFKDIEQLNKEN